MFRKPSQTQIRNITVVWMFTLLFTGQGIRNLIGLIPYTALTIATLTVIIILFHKKWKTRKTPVLLAAFTITAVASTLWSETRGVTLIAVTILLATTAAAMLVGFNYKLKQLLPHLAAALQITIVTSLLFETVTVFTGPITPFFDELSTIAGVTQEFNWSDGALLTGGPIQGLPGNRNLLGFAALLLVTVTIIRTLERQTTKMNGVAWILIGTATHLLTMSAAVTLAFIAILILLAGAYGIRRTPERYKKTVSIIYVTACLAGGVFMLRSYDIIFGWLDRGPTISNRTTIWVEVSKYALERPEGWGWVNYWPVWKYPYNQIVNIDRLPVAHAHNAFLDVWLQTGVIGLTLLLLMFLQTLSSNWRLIQHSHVGDSYMPLGVFLLTTCLFIQSLTESRLLLEGNWVLFTLMVMYTPQMFKKKKLLTTKEPIL